jgi:hypothetical protein
MNFKTQMICNLNNLTQVYFFKNTLVPNVEPDDEELDMEKLGCSSSIDEAYNNKKFELFKKKIVFIRVKRKGEGTGKSICIHMFFYFLHFQMMILHNLENCQ